MVGFQKVGRKVEYEFVILRHGIPVGWFDSLEEAECALSSFEGNAFVQKRRKKNEEEMVFE